MANTMLLRLVPAVVVNVVIILYVIFKSRSHKHRTMQPVEKIAALIDRKDD